MDETIISHFDRRYYDRAFTGVIAFFVFTVYVAYCVFAHVTFHVRSLTVATPLQGYLLLAICIGADWVYYHFFSKSWLKVTVTPAEIIVDNVVTKKKVTILYADITHIGTYRTPGSDGLNMPGFSQDFVIEYGNDQWVGINEAWYDNYHKLTMTIYLHKYGPGHGRERYLERHGRG